MDSVLNFSTCNPFLLKKCNTGKHWQKDFGFSDFAFFFFFLSMCIQCKPCTIRNLALVRNTLKLWHRMAFRRMSYPGFVLNNSNRLGLSTVGLDLAWYFRKVGTMCICFLSFLTIISKAFFFTENNSILKIMQLFTACLCLDRRFYSFTLLLHTIGKD